MIPLRELRIGNLVQKDGKLHVVQENDFLQVNNFEHVPVEWWNVLIYLNYKPTNSLFKDFYHEDSKSHYCVVYNDFYFKHGDRFACYKCRTLSHLQNLIFFTTGTELDISSLLKARQ